VIDGLDPVIHVPKRLAAMAILANAPSASFRFLRDRLEVSEARWADEFRFRAAACRVRRRADRSIT
jgi:hypothetical protein